MRTRLIPAVLLVALTAACSGDHDAPSPQASAVHSGLGPRGSAAADAAHPPAQAQPTPSPKLVVVVVVDQMRFDYYERFGQQWAHGFVRLRDQGRFFAQAHHEHALTETAPGHATISTGTDPAKHGIVANGWFDRSTGARVNAVDDRSATILGNPSETGVSSATLLRESVGDWAQAHDPAAVVVALAVKDRAAILLGGKRPDAAIWYDDEFGGFTTSTYYAEARPAWVDAYNAKGRADALVGEGWTLSRPDAEYGASRRLTDPELVSTYSDYALTKQFPHTIAVAGQAPRNVVRDTPFGDIMTLELARDAIAAEQMGADAVPDLLLIGLSSGDYAGHRYGPDSVEVHDYYLRMDAALGEFVDDLDRQLGAANYTLILTADHGVAPFPEYSGLDGAGRFDLQEHAPKQLAQAVEAAGLAEAPTLGLSHGVDLLFADAVPEADRVELRASLAALLGADPRVAHAWTRDELLDPSVQLEHVDAWRRTFHGDRSSDILIQNAPGVVSYPEGTGHGTPYEYDQHVPLIIRGPGWAGVEADRVATVDIAPTIATLLGVAVADGVDGHALAPSSSE